MKIRILKDDDGHTYFVPVGQEDAFETWVAAAPYWEDYVGPEFEDIGCSVSCYTFENPVCE